MEVVSKAMPGSIPTLNSGSLQKSKKIQVAKWDTPKKYLEKKFKVINEVDPDEYVDEIETELHFHSSKLYVSTMMKLSPTF